ncbi:TetR/AcrR family transcriptional regulator [Streptomyces sp. WMMC897]|uniref:TetR/AcrR family transcriptional regulator n=1 Tax=Streptomyces sp. WMMC897 TaxID=3014782 RepID=UPI0022B73F0A|nr:TetR/AcrR family transcriptional regulator [Streptomyces sp. WMMC897]MCZ7413885.1 TetR/AcrR family transcriptional regulator [Streptomyces sp. WMMC897]
MARPPRFSTDQLLDAAVRLAAAAGPPGVTMAAVAQAAGAPSGSVYHRFPGRDVLLAEVWLRTVERFQEGYLAALTAEGDVLRSGPAASRHVVVWSRRHPEQAAVLLHGPEAFGRERWPAEQRERADRGNDRVFAALRTATAPLGGADPETAERLVLALVDLPLTLVRRHLRSGGTLPPHAESLAEYCTATLLTASPPG